MEVRVRMNRKAFPKPPLNQFPALPEKRKPPNSMAGRRFRDFPGNPVAPFGWNSSGSESNDSNSASQLGETDLPRLMAFLQRGPQREGRLPWQIRPMSVLSYIGYPHALVWAKLTKRLLRAQ